MAEVAKPSVIALIPESTRKAKGGDPYAKAVDGFADVLPKGDKDRLLTLRAEVASTWKNPAARDGVMPAYLRFQGNMYRRISHKSWETRKADVEILMVSALYGLVASQDTVFAYPHSMAEPMPPFGKLNRWWRDHGLPAILASYLGAVRPARVIDLLSQEYREAVEGYGAALRVTPDVIDFPGMGRGSQPLRGEKIDQLLRTGKL